MDGEGESDDYGNEVDDEEGEEEGDDDESACAGCDGVFSQWRVLTPWNGGGQDVWWVTRD